VNSWLSANFGKLLQGYSLSGFERDGVYLNQGGRFLDVSGISGLDSISDGRAAVYGDFDNDGDLDVFLTTIQGAGHLLFRNNVGQDSAWLRVSLTGTRSGRDAFGAQVRVKFQGGVQTRVKSGGEGFMSQHDPRLLFGLGQDAQADWVEVTWPSGQKQRVGPVPARASIHLVEGEEGFTRLAEQVTRLPEPLSATERRAQILRLKVGDAFPSLKVRTEEGPSVAAQPFAGAQRTLVTLWATWCTTCAEDLPALDRARPQLEARGVTVLGMAVDTEVGPAEVVAYLRGKDVGFPTLQLEAAAFEQLYVGDVLVVPVGVLVDARGVVERILIGSAELRGYLASP
jgi:thiol-disulfide isomerase/thioredoxin